MFSGVQNTPLRKSVWIEGSLTTGSSENCGILRQVPIIMTVKFSLGLQLYLSLDSFGTFLGEEERYFSSIFPVFFVSLQWPQKFCAGQENTLLKIGTVKESLLEEALAGGSVKKVFLKKQGCSKFTKNGLYYSWRFLWLFRNI